MEPFLHIYDRYSNLLCIIRNWGSKLCISIKKRCLQNNKLTYKFKCKVETEGNPNCLYTNSKICQYKFKNVSKNLTQKEFTKLKNVSICFECTFYKSSHACTAGPD